MKTLPNKLSALLELAVRDVQKCEAEPARFKLNMGLWHAPESGVCCVCMAGAVMAQTLGVDDTKLRYVHIGFDGVDDDIAPFGDQLLAINDARKGDFREAASQLGGSPGGSHLDARQRAALDAASSTVVRNLPECPVEYDSDFGESWDNSPGYRAPWPVYLEAAAILREAGL